jgi:hypothetical protein
MTDQLFNTITFSHSNRQKFLIYLKEICKREKVSEEDVLTWLNWQIIANDQKIQGKHKSEHLIQKLFERRFPETTKLIKTGLWNL